MNYLIKRRLVCNHINNVMRKLMNKRLHIAYVFILLKTLLLLNILYKQDEQKRDP